MVWTLKKIWYRTYQTVFKYAMYVLDWREPKLLEGKGSTEKLPQLIKSKGIKKVLIVTGPTVSKMGMLDSLYAKLTETGIEYVVFNRVQANPTIPNIEDAKDMYIQNGCEGIIAFGGGSPMDCAKVAGARVVKPNKTVRQMRGQLKILKKIPPLFAIPTTAGTGSEATIAAVVTDPDTHEKNAVNDTHLIPQCAVLDPVHTIGLPPHITSTTGMDALTHAVEAYIGRSNTKQTTVWAEQAVEMIFKNLQRAYNDGTDIEARTQMLKASYYAGLAFTRAYVGYVHAIAHNLGGLYGTPHGLANAVILPYVLDFYGESAYPKLAKLADVAGIGKQGMTESEKGRAFIAAIRALNENMNIPKTFDMIEEKDMPILVKRALKEANPLYPVPKIMDAAECEAVIRSFMA